MTESICAVLISPLRQRLIEEMELRHFSIETKRNYIGDVVGFAAWLGRPPNSGTTEDLHRFQVQRREAGMPSRPINSVVVALRFSSRTHWISRLSLEDYSR